MIDGQKVGACPKESPFVQGSVAGRFSENATLTAYVDPQVPVCAHWGKYTKIWTPSPCYAEVYPIQLSGCAYIDVTDDTWHTGACGNVLYDGSQPPGPLFEIGPTAGYKCGAEQSDFSTFVLGGPATQKDKIWTSEGPRDLRCGIHMAGPRPNGLYGPTWVVLVASIGVGQTGDGLSKGSTAQAEFYVPIDGDMRDLGPVAGFDVMKNEAGEVAFRNTSIHTLGEPMTYRWDFGDGATSTASDPTHVYHAPGTYPVTLTAIDPSGDEDDTRDPVRVRFELIVNVSAEPPNAKVGEDALVRVSIRNPFDVPAEDFRLITPEGARFDPRCSCSPAGPTPCRRRSARVGRSWWS